MKYLSLVGPRATHTVSQVTLSNAITQLYIFLLRIMRMYILKFQRVVKAISHEEEKE